MKVRITLDGSRYVMRRIDADPHTDVDAFILHNGKPKYWTKREAAEKYAIARLWHVVQ